jgi:hypothetical protein
MAKSVILKRSHLSCVLFSTDRCRSVERQKDRDGNHIVRRRRRLSSSYQYYCSTAYSLLAIRSSWPALRSAQSRLTSHTNSSKCQHRNSLPACGSALPVMLGVPHRIPLSDPSTGRLSTEHLKYEV